VEAAKAAAEQPLILPARAAGVVGVPELCVAVLCSRTGGTGGDWGLCCAAGGVE